MKKTYTDQMKRSVEIPFPPQRIVSLVPSQSELLWDLGLQHSLKGITKFCIHPAEMYQSVKRIGGTKKLHLDEIEKINPDLIIGNKEENTREEIEYLEKKFPVWMSDVNSYSDALEMIRLIGEITHKPAEALVLVKEIQQAFNAIKKPVKLLSVIYLIWKNPYMAVGTHSFIHDMLQQCGLQNAVLDERYPEISIEEIKKSAPDIIILSTEPFPFSQADVDFFQGEVPSSKIWLADGEMFTWYGSRMKISASYVTQNLPRFL